MSSRFGAVVHELVGQVREEFTDPSGGKTREPATSAQAPPTGSGPAAPQWAPDAWRLAAIASLSGPAQSDPIVGRASALIMATPQGKALHKDIQSGLRPAPRIRVEAYPSSSTLRSRQEQLAGIGAREQPEGQLQGFTHAYVDGDFSVHDAPSEIVKNVKFVIGAGLPGARPSSAIIVEEDDWMETSTPFRILRLATTLVHELLHVWWQIVKADPEQHLVVSDKHVEIVSTGHQGDTSFHIDPKSLRLVATGSIDSIFRKRLEDFVREASTKPKLATALSEERKRFRQMRR